MNEEEMEDYIKDCEELQKLVHMACTNYRTTIVSSVMINILCGICLQDEREEIGQGSKTVSSFTLAMMLAFAEQVKGKEDVQHIWIL